MVKLTKQQIQSWKENGFIKLSNIFSKEEIENLSVQYDKTFANRENLEAAWEGSDVKKLAKDKPVSVQSIHNLQYHNAAFSKILHNDSMLEALEDLMETPNILLHHTKAHNKPPGRGAPYPMHQDYHYFPYKKHSMVAVFIHVDKADPENGGLCVYPGSHKNGPLEDFGTTGESGDSYHYQDPEKYPIDGATSITGEPGDVVVFSYLLLHGSYMNLSDRSRRMFLIQLKAAEDEPVSEVHKSPGQDWVLRGCNPKRRAHFSERFLH